MVCKRDGNYLVESRLYDEMRQILRFEKSYMGWDLVYLVGRPFTFTYAPLDGDRNMAFEGPWIYYDTFLSMHS